MTLNLEPPSQKHKKYNPFVHGAHGNKTGLHHGAIWALGIKFSTWYGCPSFATDYDVGGSLMTVSGAMWALANQEKKNKVDRHTPLVL